MVTFAGLRDAQPRLFGQAADNWERHAVTVRDCAAELRRQVQALDSWQGDAGDAARTDLTKRQRELTDAAEWLGKIPPVLRDQERDQTSAQRDLRAALADAAEFDLLVFDDGSVSAGYRGPGNMHEDWELEQRRAQHVAQAISEAVRSATTADEENGAALRALLPADAGLAPPPGTPVSTVPQGSIPTRGTPPAEVNRWWNSLTPMQQESLIFTDSATIGALDGIPTIVRDRANRAELAEEQARLRQRKELLVARGDGRTVTEQRELGTINGALDGMAAIETRLNAPVTAGQQQAYLLDFDARGPNSQAVVTVGNPDTADNVVTTVPGTGSRLAEIGGYLDRSDRLADSAHRADRSESTAAITWIGYEAPQDIVAATESGYAETATRDLDRFQHGLRATHEGPASHNTVLGHSYGSTVVGHTAHDRGLAADAVIFIGSPGIGVDHASDLGIPPEHVWSSTAENDVIRLGGPVVHGPDPTGEDFGGQTFTSDPGHEDWYGYSVGAHSQYWDPRSASLENMGKIVVGKEPA
ncbi:MAG: alpha/beta hydrolase [Pseudonocardiaceae bacterium]